MKITIIIQILMLSVLPILGGHQPEEVEIWRLEQYQNAEWKAFSFGLGHEYGDVYAVGNRILIQKISDDQASLSFKKDNHSLPVHLIFIPMTEAEAIRKKISEFHKVALYELCIDERIKLLPKDKREKEYEKYGPDGTTYTEMLLKISIPDYGTIGLSTNFDERKSTGSEFKKYFKELLIKK